MPRLLINLEDAINEKCQGCKNFDDRDKHILNDLCRTALSVQDGLAIRCVGSWGRDKIYRLLQYFGIFSRGMYKKWGGLNYLELCSGPGRCVLRETGCEIDGTALAILRHPSFVKHLKKAVFIDYNLETVEILNQRIESAKLEEKAHAFCVDFNDIDKLREILQLLDKNSLNLVLVDPTGCDVPFGTLKIVSDYLGKVDFILNVALGTDLRRNIERAVFDEGFAKAKLKYSSFLGDDNFFETDKIKSLIREKKMPEIMNKIMEEYKENWRKLGYNYFGEKEVEHYYRIMFISRHPKGLEFWEKANKYDPNGQMTWEGF